MLGGAAAVTLICPPFGDAYTNSFADEAYSQAEERGIDAHTALTRLFRERYIGMGLYALFWVLALAGTVFLMDKGTMIASICPVLIFVVTVIVHILNKRVNVYY